MADIKRYMTPPFRLSFPTLFEPESMDDKGPKKYGLSAVWTPADFTEADKKKWRTIMVAINEASKDRFKKAWKDLPDNIKKGIRDGSERADMEGYGNGTKFANITSKMKPGVINLDNERLGPEDIYPGCYCRATVTVYTYDNKGKGVALGLMNVQKIKDGERLDSRTDAEDDFDDEVDAAWLEGEEDGGKVDDDDGIPF